MEFKVSIEALIEASEATLDVLQKPVEQISSDIPYGPPSRDLVWRCILNKSYHSFRTIIEMVRTERTWLAHSLIRTMCEDLIHVRYLNGLPQEDADEVVRIKSLLEVEEALIKEWRQWTEGGWKMGEDKVPMPERLRNAYKEAREEWKALGVKLGWSTPKKGPTVREIAEKHSAGEKIYGDAYYLTSKSVHFSPHSLMRMLMKNADGKWDVKRASSLNRLDMANAMHTGAWIFCLAVIDCSHHHIADQSCFATEFMRYLKTLHDFGKPPNLLSWELKGDQDLKAGHDQD